MKFKAVIENEGAGANQGMMLHVLQALQRLERASERRPAEKRGASACILLKITAESFAFCHRAGADEGSQTWSHFQVTRLFKEYRIESKRGNRIDLEAPIANLLHVFHSCATSERTTFRLANGKDGRPVLGFEFTMSGTVADHRVEQDVPVRVVPETEADAICEPALPEPEYQIELPQNLQRLRGVLDRMRQVGALHVAVEAARDKAGASAGVAAGGRASLRLAAQSEFVSLASTFPSLALVMEGKTSAAPDGPVRLLLSIRRLGEVLAAFQQVSAEAHIACVLENRALVLYALLPSGMGSLISYTPVVT